jgi:PAS domain S-box-containing protein
MESDAPIILARRPLSVCLRLTSAISRATTPDEIYTPALDALAEGLGVQRASILLFDENGVMRFKAARGLSSGYQAAVEGHTPWAPDTIDPQPIIVSDVDADPSLGSLHSVITAEGIRALAFIPLVSLGRVIGKFMLYYPVPHDLAADELELAGLIASQVAFAVERTRSESRSRESEERLRFALDAAMMGTWDWDMQSNQVRWSDNLASIHGLPADAFDGTFASYEREIHPDDRPRVLASIRRAVEEGVPHDVEYRIVGPDGTVRWVEGKGRVVYDASGRPAQMSGVCMVVTRRKAAEQARLAAAEEASRLKDEFLATLSHELRTPLNAIVGWVHLLQSGELSPDRVGRAVEIIRRNAKQQSQLIDDILDVSRIITGKLQVERESVQVPTLVEATISALLPIARATGVEMYSSVARDLPPIDGDAQRLQQVLTNVLSNAIKFTPAGGRIDVIASLDGDTIKVVVRDTGIGVDPAFLPHMFDRFRQADSRSTRRHAGLGLGLAIARHLIEQHGGELKAQSPGVGCGTTVEVSLPRSLSHAPATAASEAEAQPLPDLGLRGTTVLIVDDQSDSRELLAVLFDRAGATAVSCESATAALAALDASLPALVVADLAMPDVDGYQFITAVRGRWPALPAVAVSAYARPEDRARAIAAGFNGFCPKPFDMADLWRTVAMALQ